MVTGDVMWITYDNDKGKWSWSNGTESKQTVAKADESQEDCAL